VQTKELLIPPAARYEVLVRGGKPGKYALKALRFNTGPAGDHYPPQCLAMVVSKGPKVPNPTPLPTVFPSPPDLRLQSITTNRVITFADATNSTNPNQQFTINGKFYDHNRVDTTVQLGTVEQRTILNSSTELHVLHIHQTDFQVVPGEVTVIMPFTNPVILGEFVYHCHIVQHADQGMMANIEVVAPATAPAR
jgi:FtsP/CotA-like multicopper oxidase with cupredoxin domain